MRINRLCAAAVAAVFAVGMAAAPAAAQGRTKVTTLQRVDVDANGVPGTDTWTRFSQVSRDGRYVLLEAASHSTLVPSAYRTPGFETWHHLRKDLRTGELALIDRKPDGVPLRGSAEGAMTPDGQRFVYTSWDNSNVVYYSDLRTTRQIAALSPDVGVRNLSVSADGQWVSWVAGNKNDRGATIQRHNLATGDTVTLLTCPDPATGCYLHLDPVVSHDGTKFLFSARPSPTEEIRLTVLDATTGQSHVLPEGLWTEQRGFTMSGDGRWAFYILGGGTDTRLKKVATTPGASPVLLKSWENSPDTWGATTSNATDDASAVGLAVQSNASGPWFATAPGHVVNQKTGQYRRLPDSPTPAKTYLERPTISGDGHIGIASEYCLFGESCAGLGIYSVRLSLQGLTTP